MPHIRKQIRDAVQTAVTGLPTTGANVFPSRARNLSSSQLPALLIYVPREEIEETRGTAAARTQARAQEINVEGRVEEVTAEAVEDALDQIALEVEKVLNDNELGGLAHFMTLRSTESDVTAQGKKHEGEITLTYTVLCATKTNDPETAL